VLAGAIAFVLGGCGGGGGGGSSPVPGATPTPPVVSTPSPTPLPGSSTASIPVSPGSAASGTFGPVSGGFSGTVTLPAASAASTLSATLWPGNSQPVGTPAIQNLRRRPQNIGAQNIVAIAFVTVTPSATVTFPKTPDFTFTATFPVAQVAAFAYVAEYDPTKPAGTGWTTIEGPALAAGNTLTFTGAPPPITLQAGVTYGFLLFTVPQALPTPGPAPSTTPAPVPSPTLNPQCKSLAPQTVGSAYTLQSNPSGIAVQRIDPSVTTTQCVYFTGVTQVSDIPQSAPHPWNYVFAPAQANPYVVSVAQQFTGAHTVFYNQAGDSAGAISASSLQSFRRSGSASRGYAEVRRGVRRFTGPGVVPDVVLVRYRGGAAQMRARSQQIAAGAGVASGAEITTAAGTYERFVHVPAGTDATTFASSLRSQSGVSDVFPVHKRFALTRAATPVNDLHGNNVDQWYLFADGFPNAWTYTKGDGTKIAIVDTGVDLGNTDLSQKLDYSTGYRSAGLTAQDTNGHGTNVAGLAVAMTNNMLGFAGGGYNVRLLAYNIFPDATATSDAQFASVADEVTAINDAVARGVDVISMSIGAAQDYGNANGFDQGEHDAVEAAIAAGVVVVAAAGNDADGGESGVPHSLLDYPAAYDGVISVGATSMRDNNTQTFAGSTEYVTPYSQGGPGLAVVAPGGDPGSNDVDPLHWIWNYSTSTAAYPRDQCNTPSPATSCTAFFAGTSQATPQVAAAAALVLAAAGGHHSLTPARVLQIINDTADNIGDARQGHGRLNVYKAVAAVSNDSGAYSGPSSQKTSPTQVVAFAYGNPRGNKPTILNVNYPNGVPLDSNGNFRIADVPANQGTYGVGVWYDANGNGIIDAGDQFGSPANSCNSTQKCTIGTVTMTTVTAGFTLP
jgi:subtilisin family serine protease